MRIKEEQRKVTLQSAARAAYRRVSFLAKDLNGMHALVGVVLWARWRWKEGGWGWGRSGSWVMGGVGGCTGGISFWGVEV